jgi:hypothetical protein
MLDDKLREYETAAKALSNSELQEACNDILRNSHLNDFIPHDSPIRIIQRHFHVVMSMAMALQAAKQAVMEEAALRWLKQDAWEQQHYRAGYQAGERSAREFPRGEGA